MGNLRKSRKHDYESVIVHVHHSTHKHADRMQVLNNYSRHTYVTTSVRLSYSINQHQQRYNGEREHLLYH